MMLVYIRTTFKDQVKLIQNRQMMKNFKVELNVAVYWPDFCERAIYFDLISLQQNTTEVRIYHKVLQEVYDWMLHL